MGGSDSFLVLAAQFLQDLASSEEEMSFPPSCAGQGRLHNLQGPGQNEEARGKKPSLSAFEGSSGWNRNAYNKLLSVVNKGTRLLTLPSSA